jgi:hypothetical protein
MVFLNCWKSGSNSVLTLVANCYIFNNYVGQKLLANLMREEGRFYSSQTLSILYCMGKAGGNEGGRNVKLWYFQSGRSVGQSEFVYNLKHLKIVPA